MQTIQTLEVWKSRCVAVEQKRTSCICPGTSDTVLFKQRFKNNPVIGGRLLLETFRPERCESIRSKSHLAVEMKTSPKHQTGVWVTVAAEIRALLWSHGCFTSWF